MDERVRQAAPRFIDKTRTLVEFALSLAAASTVLRCLITIARHHYRWDAGPQPAASDEVRPGRSVAGASRWPWGRQVVCVAVIRPTCPDPQMLAVVEQWGERENRQV